MEAKPAWDDLRLLLSIGRTGSFLKAARLHAVATSTLSRRLTQLEAQLGQVLLERRSDGVRLTHAGQQLFAIAQDLELRLETGLRELSTGTSGELKGVVRATCGDGFGSLLAGAAADFERHHPRVRFELAVETRWFDLGKREADVAVRMVRGTERSLVHAEAGQLDYGLWAAGPYLERRGTPRSQAQLGAHAFAALAGNDATTRWLKGLGARTIVCQSTTFAALLAAVRAGIGIAALPALVSTGLVRVLPSVRTPPLPVYVVMHAEARRQPHVRAFAQAVSARVRAVLSARPEAVPGLLGGETRLPLSSSGPALAQRVRPARRPE
jgi:DNA-binding transcriptional LysR family regulator